jgi:AcrR family transcriptional regulator
LSEADPSNAPAAAPRRGGRPSREDAERLGRLIIEVATEMFLSQGYGATSIDAIAKQASISKRTFYHRFPDKAGLFTAVIRDIVARLRPANVPDGVGLGVLFEGASLEKILLRLAHLALRAAMQPQALALQRLILAEVPRFPDLAAATLAEGTRSEAVFHLTSLLEREKQAGRIAVDQPAFAAEQFFQMVLSVPQRRAMGLGATLSPEELDDWERQTVTLFLHGCRPQKRPNSGPDR